MARRRTRFVRPAPKTKMWIGAGVGITALTGSTLHQISTLSAGALLLRPFTILRTRMEILYQTDQAAAIERGFANYAQIVVTDKAAALGVTAVPDPNADPEADWFVFEALSNSFFIDINGTDGIGVDGNMGTHYVVDSKAMRKVGPDDDIVAMCTQNTAVGAELITNGRRLIQLH